ncbi:MAG: hypothetical protein ACOC0N_05680 [Chroococcales cyanobacterium]
MKTQLIPIQDLSVLDKNAMFTLLNTHFKGVKSDVFNADLNSKNWVILLKYQNTNTLKGFSTILIYETVFQDELITVIYSGDTIVDPSAWSTTSLSHAWIHSVKYLRQDYPHGKLYWLLISSGYRTYRFLPVFWKEFYPVYNQQPSSKTTALIQFLSFHQFGKNYNPETGIVRFPYPQQLREGLDEIPPQRLNNPHIRFFVEKNPGHSQGDELVCLTEVNEANLTPAGQRIWFSKDRIERIFPLNQQQLLLI